MRTANVTWEAVPIDLVVGTTLDLFLDSNGNNSVDTSEQTLLIKSRLRSSNGMSKQRSWTDEQLRAAVASSTAYGHVLRKLGLNPNGASHWTIKARMQELGIDIIRRPTIDDQLRDIVPSSTTFMNCHALQPTHRGLNKKTRRE